MPPTHTPMMESGGTDDQTFARSATRATSRKSPAKDSGRDVAETDPGISRRKALAVFLGDDRESADEREIGMTKTDQCIETVRQIVDLCRNGLLIGAHDAVAAMIYRGDVTGEFGRAWQEALR